jgi:polysaccharide deacetylase 2 family uncharacterized protein YibQ
MRTTIVSLAVIGLALVAIVAGYVSGEAGARPPAIAGVRPAPSREVVAVLRGASDSAVHDLFSNDDVVVERPAMDAANWLPARLSIVVGLCGNSSVIDAQFLRLGVPLAFDVDPSGADAETTAKYAHASGDLVFVHYEHPPRAAEIASLRKRFEGIDGFASRDPSGMPRALARSGLAFFDERGDALETPFRDTGVTLYQRDATVDDRTARSYVGFMLARSAMRSERQGRLVVLVRPLVSSLDALESFEQTRSAQIVPLTQGT